METFEAQTIDEAIAAALAAFKTDRDQLDIQILEQPRRGFLGIGRRNAKIKVALKQPVKPAPVKTIVKKQAVKTKADPKPVLSTPAKAKAADKEAEPDALEMERRHRANVKKMEQAAQALCGYLKDVLAALGVASNPKVVKLRAHELTVDLQANNSGRVIGYHGRRINALEQLGTAFLNYHGIDDPGLILDTSDYRKKRQQSLEKLASRCVTEVIATGQAVFLDPMPARERKYLHRVLEDNPRVKTYSHGRDPYRSVVVAPKN